MQSRKAILWAMPALLVFGGARLSAGTLFFSYGQAAGAYTGNSGSNPGAFFAGSDYEPNGLSAAYSNSGGGITGYGYANVSTGAMGIQSTGNIPTDSGTIWNNSACGELGDTIFVTGDTTGQSLTVNLAVDGSSSFSDPSQNLTWVTVAAFAPGYYDNPSGSPLFANAYVLGPGTLDYTSIFASLGGGISVNYAGSYGSGAQTIPVSIPFSTLGTSFELVLAIQSDQAGDASTGYQWDVDYSHTLQASLSAPAGVTLTSGSGEFPGTGAAAPEPGSMALLAGGLAILGWFSRSRACRRQ
jgi:hypothetical protein